MSETIEMTHEDALPGHESRLEPKPEWEPRYPGSSRLAGKVAVESGAGSGTGRAVAAPRMTFRSLQAMLYEVISVRSSSAWARPQ